MEMERKTAKMSRKSLKYLCKSNTFERRFRHFKISTKPNGKLDILTSRNRRSESFEKQMEIERKAAKMTKKSMNSLYNSNTFERRFRHFKMSTKPNGKLDILTPRNRRSETL